MTKAQVRAELEPAGFEVVREFDRLPWQHLLFMGVREADRGGTAPAEGRDAGPPAPGNPGK